MNSSTDLIMLCCLISSILTYIAFFHFSNKYSKENEALILSKIKLLLNVDEEIILCDPPEKTSPLAILPMFFLQGFITAIFGVLFYIFLHIMIQLAFILAIIAGGLLLFTILMVDYLNSPLAKLIITNKRVIYGRIRENRTPKSISFSEIKLVETYYYRTRGSLIIRKHKGFPIIIHTQNAYSIKSQLDKLIFTPEKIKEQTTKREKEDEKEAFYIAIWVCISPIIFFLILWLSGLIKH